MVLQSPYRQASVAGKSSSSPSSLKPKFVSESYAEPDPEKRDIRYCDRLFEIPSLKGIKIAQAVAGARSSFVRTEVEGRVLAWGANEYG